MERKALPLDAVDRLLDGPKRAPKASAHTAAGETRASATAEGGVPTRRYTVHPEVDLLERLHDYAYWKRRGMSETTNEAVREHLKA